MKVLFWFAAQFIGQVSDIVDLPDSTTNEQIEELHEKNRQKRREAEEEWRNKIEIPDFHYPIIEEDTGEEKKKEKEDDGLNKATQPKDKGEKTERKKKKQKTEKPSDEPLGDASSSITRE